MMTSSTEVSIRKNFFGMPNTKTSKIQSLVIKHLLDHGTLDIRLPDGIILEIGIVQTDENGNRIKSDDYCFVQATRNDKKTLLDSYNLGLTFADDPDMMVFEDKGVDESGTPFRHVEVI